jgi:glycosyltransferase involved in cell wall biosynthesis
VDATNLRARRPPAGPPSALPGAVPRRGTARDGRRQPPLAPLRRVVFTWLSTGRGGAERSVGELAAGLRGYGLEVTVVWWRVAIDCSPPDLAGQVVVRQVTSGRQYITTLADALDAGAAAGTVVVSNHRTVLLDLQACARRNVPVVPVLRGLLIPGRPLRIVDPDSLRLLACSPERMPWPRLAGAACWVGISRASAVSVASYLPAGVPVRAIYNGIRPRHPAAPAHDREAGRPLRCVTVARATGWKHVDTVIAAVSALPAGLCRLDVYGDGPRLVQLRTLAQQLNGPVRLHGYVADLHRRLMDADLLVSGSRDEGFGRAVAEAAALGVPAVVPAGGTSSELVLHGLTGWVYDPADPDALPALLAEIAGMPAGLAVMGERARVRAAGLFSPQRCAAEFLDVCHAAAAAQVTICGAGDGA